MTALLALFGLQPQDDGLGYIDADTQRIRRWGWATPPIDGQPLTDDDHGVVKPGHVMTAAERVRKQRGIR